LTNLGNLKSSLNKSNPGCW